MDMFNRLTHSASNSFDWAQSNCQEANLGPFDTVHLLLGLLFHDGLARKVLGELGVTLEVVRQKAAGLTGAED